MPIVVTFALILMRVPMGMAQSLLRQANWTMDKKTEAKMEKGFAPLSY